MKQIKFYVYKRLDGSVFEFLDKPLSTSYEFIGIRTLEIQEPEEKRERRKINISNDMIFGVHQFSFGQSADLVELHHDEIIVSEQEVRDALEVYLNKPDKDLVIRELFKKEAVNE